MSWCVNVNFGQDLFFWTGFVGVAGSLCVEEMDDFSRRIIQTTPPTRVAKDDEDVKEIPPSFADKSYFNKIIHFPFDKKLIEIFAVCFLMTI